MDIKEMLDTVEKAMDMALDAATEKIDKLQECINDIEAVSCGETQIECDGDYNDSDGMRWIYKRIQALKEK